MDEVKAMTVAEIGVMREIVRWRRTARHTYSPMNSRYLGHWAEWIDGSSSFGRRVTVDYSAPDRFAVREAGRFTSSEWYPAKTFTEAVDMLVALGYLPARFSTAYLAGWDAGHDNAGWESGYGEMPSDADSTFPAVSA